jgi:hypothetical protein
VEFTRLTIRDHRRDRRATNAITGNYTESALAFVSIWRPAVGESRHKSTRCRHSGTEASFTLRLIPKADEDAARLARILSTSPDVLAQRLAAINAVMEQLEASGEDTLGPAARSSALSFNSAGM